MQVKVFYAWQDDRPSKTTRYLIRDAALEACARISSDRTNEYELSLDEATTDEPGMCDIPNTILAKIRNCDIFLVDLTFIESSPESSRTARQFSNPNVVLELGYAARAKGFKRILAVMNSVYGQPKHHMFDIKRRWAMQYKLEENSTKFEIDNAKNTLSKQIEVGLRTILKKAIKATVDTIIIERFHQLRSNFENAVRAGTFGRGLHKAPAIAVVLVPEKEYEFEYHQLQFLPLIPLGSSGGDPELSGKSILSVNPAFVSQQSKGVRCRIAELTINGVISSANTYILDPSFRPPLPGVPGDLVSSNELDACLIRGVTRFCQILMRLGAAPPWRLGISLIGIRGYKLVAHEREIGRVEYPNEDMIADAVMISQSQQFKDEDATRVLLRTTLDYIWREFGFERWGQ